VQRWLAGASAGDTILGTGTAGTAANQLSNPIIIFFDNKYNILIVDRGNNRVQFFNRTVC
jgi:DNA modification methylase